MSIWQVFDINISLIMHCHISSMQSPCTLCYCIMGNVQGGFIDTDMLCNKLFLSVSLSHIISTSREGSKGIYATLGRHFPRQPLKQSSLPLLPTFLHRTSGSGVSGPRIGNFFFDVVWTTSKYKCLHITYWCFADCQTKISCGASLRTVCTQGEDTE